MKIGKWIAIIGLIFFISGLFQLTEWKFGWYSDRSEFGIIISMFGLIMMKLERLEKNDKNGKNKEK